jgi:hypothetical protein
VRFRYKVLSLIAGVFALGFLHFQLRADTWPVVLAGQPAPGTADGRFTGFGPASVNASGDMAFYAGLNVGGVQSAGIFKVVGGALSPVVLEGQLSPDSSGRSFGGALGAPQINNSGDIVFAANFTGASPYRGIFLSSGSTLQKVIDQVTPIPGAPGQPFDNFDVRINDAGDVAFAASLFSTSFGSGVFLISHGSLQTVVLNPAGSPIPSISFNNNGDIAFTTFPDGISLFSGGAISPIASQGQPVSNSSLVIQGPREPWINDARDIVFITHQSSCCTGRGAGTQVPNAIIRWRNGVLDKIVATGDRVPGFSGSVFDSQFDRPEINQAAIMFTGGTLAAAGQPSVRLVGKLQDYQLSVVTSENQVIEGIGALSLLEPGQANFDNRRGSVVSFLSSVASSSAVFAEFAGRFTSLFPQIADGTSAGGGWRTTVVLANRSTVPATALISFFNDNGTPLNVGIGGQQQSQVSITVPALGVAQIQTDGTGTLAAGWAMVQSDQNLSGIALFGFSDSSGKLIDEVGAPATVPLRAMSAFVQAGPGVSTGVALANPNAVSSDVTLILRDANSNEIARTSLTIPANGHLAKYVVGELFPFAQRATLQGKLEIVSTQSLVALTLRQRESIFTSLPVIP